MLELRFGLNGQDEHTLEAVAGMLRADAISRERVRQLECAALCELERVLVA